jgi:hypothetical protein
MAAYWKLSEIIVGTFHLVLLISFAPLCQLTADMTYKSPLQEPVRCLVQAQKELRVCPAPHGLSPAVHQSAD